MQACCQPQAPANLLPGKELCPPPKECFMGHTAALDTDSLVKYEYIHFYITKRCTECKKLIILQQIPLVLVGNRNTIPWFCSP